MKLRWLLEAAGASLLILTLFCRLIFPEHLVLYLHLLPMRNLVCGILLDMFAIFLFSAAALWVVPRLAPLPRRGIGGGLAGLVIWRVIGSGVFLLLLVHQRLPNQVPAIEQFSATDWLGKYWDRFQPVFAVAIPFALGLLAWVKPAASRLVVRLVRLGLAALAFCAIWIVPQLVPLTFGKQESQAFDHTASLPQPIAGRRIVWILFDELSYNLVFDH